MLKICRICKKEFNTVTIIKNKKICSTYRMNCYKCVPYMWGREKVYQPFKICITCKIRYPNTTDNFNKRTKLNCLNSRCKFCEALDYKKRREIIKQKTFELIGYDRCKLCNYNKYDFNLSFHHLDMIKKDINISRIQSLKEIEKIKNELKKCILVCENCHREIHAGLYPDIFIPKLIDNPPQKRRREKQSKIKQECVDYLGKICKGCGYNKCNRALDFHHINPNEKDFVIGDKRESPFENLKSELKKCMLLCRNCHMEIHNKDGSIGE